MKNLASGGLEKMESRLAEPVQYSLPVGDDNIALNEYIGRPIRIAYAGKIFCINCGKLTKKSFNQGYCYPCFQSLASCDSCIMGPEKCHYAQGTCREPVWAESHCLVEHIVYLSNTSAPKVGITRASQVPTRWIDQGATQALPVMRVATRHQSGVIEHALKSHIADRTGWQAMLKGKAPAENLLVLKQRLLGTIDAELEQFRRDFGLQALTVLETGPVDIHYPVQRYPDKVKSLDLDKQPVIEGTLEGIKGQYLLLDIGVLNIRKFTAYQVTFSA